LWRRLPPENRRWIVTRALLVAAAVNVLLGVVFARLAAGELENVPIWGETLGDTSVYGDALATFFLLPAITCLLVVPAVRRDLRLGALQRTTDLGAGRPWLARPRSAPRLGLALGAICLFALGPLLALAFLLTAPAEPTAHQFVVWHTALAVCLGAIVTPLIALYAMTAPAE
jgi:hypothetical protein